ncbi:MAG: SIS domain-containing protein [Dermatophilaceae bacterium]
MFDEARLDDVDASILVDGHGALRALATAGAQVRTAVRSAQEAGLDRLADLRPRGVVVAAAGGSAAVADILEGATRMSGSIPVQTCGSGPLPGWVGALDLVIAVSQSGRATGALALAAEAARRGASVITVGAPDSPLADLSARARGLHVPVSIPGASSRTSLWAQVTPVLMAAEAIGLLPQRPGIWDSLAEVLDERARECSPGSESFVNPAKILAIEIAESTPILLGSGPLGGVAVRRASAMLGRTGRVPVAFGALPDAASQIVACFDGPLADGGPGDADVFADPFLDGPTRPPLRLILLRDASSEGASSRRLADAVIAAAQDAGARVSFLDAESPEPLLRLAHHVALTDFAATYLALGHGYDPADSPHTRLLRDLPPI